MSEINSTPKKTQFVMSLTIQDKQVLYSTYMPPLIGGGLFIPTSRIYELGNVIAITLNLLDDPEKYVFTGVVSYITPKGASNNKSPGIGVQFEGENAQKLRTRIETILVDLLNSHLPTHTF